MKSVFISGNVLSEADGRAVSGGSVALVRSDGERVVGITDSLGRFRIDVAEAGVFDLKITADGYAPRRLFMIKVHSDTDLGRFELKHA